MLVRCCFPAWRLAVLVSNEETNKKHIYIVLNREDLTNYFLELLLQVRKNTPRLDDLSKVM